MTIAPALAEMMVELADEAATLGFGSAMAGHVIAGHIGEPLIITLQGDLGARPLCPGVYCRAWGIRAR